MAVRSRVPEQARPRSGRGVRRALAAIGALLVLGVAALVAAVLLWSGATLRSDPVALARIAVQPFGGHVASARAYRPDGRPLPLDISDGRLTPRTRLRPGETVVVDVVVRRPGWLAWALGKTKRVRLTVRTPVARVADRWLDVPAGAPVRVRFDQPVSAVSYGGARHAASGDTVTIAHAGAVGSVRIAAAARAWERLGRPRTVTWFPRAAGTVTIASPAPGTKVTPATPLRLTFSDPVSHVLGDKEPAVSPRTSGSWSRPDGHTLLFTPSGYGASLGAQLHVDLPRAVRLTSASGKVGPATQRVSWTVPDGSTLRLEQLLARAGYLPVDWTPAHDPIARTKAAEAKAAVAPPEGSFDWRFPNTPPELRALWQAGEPNIITRGAIMAFQDEHGLATDGIAGPSTWHALLADAVAGKRSGRGYSYVYVHRKVPQSLTLWHDGHTVLSSPGNTGVPAAPTELGTFPVFEHIPVGRMSGTNPDGSHYDDPGVRWISYFNGGDAIHAFNRASYGTPQSLGCVELPLAAAAKVWPYTPIGTLVTVEN